MDVVILVLNSLGEEGSLDCEGFLNVHGKQQVNIYKKKIFENYICFKVKIVNPKGFVIY